MVFIIRQKHFATLLACQVIIISLLLGFSVRVCSTFQPITTRGGFSRISHRMASFSSFSDFLAQEPTFHHVVVGNPAGDADSIVSALSLAYVDHLIGPLVKTPVVSVPRADLALRRETVLLLEMVGISTQELTFLDDRRMTAAEVTLVDHNKLVHDELQGSNVVEILDHHMDEQAHDGVVGDLRKVEFHDSSALVASTCTLIAERMIQSRDNTMPADLAFTLLGVILLDTVNMSESAGKGTKRDQDIINSLVENTDWSKISRTEAAKDFFESDKPNTTKLYNYLSQSKFDVDFWRSLSVQDALRLDYKQFTASSGDVFGASSVLLPLEQLLEKPGFENEVLDYLSRRKIPLLAILSMVIEDSKPKRSMLVCGRRSGNSVATNMAKHLKGSESLQLSEVDCPLNTQTCTDLQIRYFEQGNPKASRKQVVPIMLDLYDKK